VVVVAVAAFTFLTWRQAAIWHDSVALWQHALTVDPESRTAHAYLGRAYADEGMIAEAVAQYEEAARRFRNKPAFYVLIGRLLEDDDNDVGALAYYRDVLAAAPGQPEPARSAAHRRAHGSAEATVGCPTEE
jgi:tetratricopeptide (TPR) repeat protein